MWHRQWQADGVFCLVYSARDEDHNNAVVIAEEVAKRLKRRAAR